MILPFLADSGWDRPFKAKIKILQKQGNLWLLNFPHYLLSFFSFFLNIESIRWKLQNHRKYLRG